MLLGFHIALALLMSIYRCTKLLNKLHRSLRIVWPIAIILGILEGYPTYSSRRDEYDVGPYGAVCASQSRDLVYLFTAPICSRLCLACYVASSIKICSAADVVKRRIWNRTQLYPIVVLITYAPRAVHVLMPDKMRAKLDPYLWFISFTFFNWTGILFFLVYTLHHQYVLRSRDQELDLRTRDETGKAFEFHVTFRGSDSVVDGMSELNVCSASGGAR